MLLYRSKNFTLNANHTLAKGLVFADLGSCPGSNIVYSSVGYKNCAYFGQPQNWVWIKRLSRFGTLHLLPNTTCIKNINGPGLDFTSRLQDFTISCWVLCLKASTSSSDTFLMRDGSYTPFQIYVEASGVMFHCGGVDKVKIVRGSTRIKIVNKLTHICAMRRGPMIYLYIDGRLEGTPEDTSSIGSHQKTGVCSSGIVNSSSQFVIADKCIWLRALSEKEIYMISRETNYTLSGLLR